MAVDANGNIIPDVPVDVTATTSPISMSSVLNPSTIGAGASLASGAVNAAMISDANKTLQQGLTTAEGTVADYAKPYATTGAAANQQLATGLQAGGQFNTPFTMANAANAPAMQTALAQGEQAIQNSAAAKGGLLGTNTLAGLSDYGQQTGAQYENQAFNQDLASKQLAMGGLENLSGTGASAAQGAGSNIANLQASGAQAGMNATLGEVGQINQGVQNAIAAYNAGQPTGTTSAAQQAAAAAAKALAAGGTSAASTTGPTGTSTGYPAGSVIDPATGLPATTTPAQIANGTVKPTQTVDPAQAAAINAQNRPTGAGGSVQPGGATTAPVTQGSTQTTTPGAASQPLDQLNQQLASQLNVPVSNSVGSTIGDLSPFNGALIIPDMTTGLPVNGLTGLPELPAATFDSWMSQLMTPTDTGNMGLGIIDPTAEFTSLPAVDLSGLSAGLDLSSINNLNLAPTSTSFADFQTAAPTYTMDQALPTDPTLI